jgi:hypothetical protein
MVWVLVGVIVIAGAAWEYCLKDRRDRNRRRRSIYRVLVGTSQSDLDDAENWMLELVERYSQTPSKRMRKWDLEERWRHYARIDALTAALKRIDALRELLGSFVDSE